MYLVSTYCAPGTAGATGTPAVHRASPQGTQCHLHPDRLEDLTFFSFLSLKAPPSPLLPRTPRVEGRNRSKSSPGWFWHYQPRTNPRAPLVRCFTATLFTTLKNYKPSKYLKVKKINEVRVVHIVKLCRHSKPYFQIPFKVWKNSHDTTVLRKKW